MIYILLITHIIATCVNYRHGEYFTNKLVFIVILNLIPKITLKKHVVYYPY